MPKFLCTVIPKTLYAGLLALAINVSAYSAPLNLQDVPLFLSASVDPNVLINMSVETPMGGAAYTDHVGIPSGCTGRQTVDGNNGVGTCYFPTTTYLGYFDPNKCYTYSTTNSRFNPAGATGTNHTCSSQWSGNFLNWASMTAIDMFILNMTGGNRILDTTTHTVIRRARKTNNDSWFPTKAIGSGVTGSVASNTVTPYNVTRLYIHNTDWGFHVGTSYSATRSGSGTGYTASFTAAVRVCHSATGITPESNCVAYGSYYKPEGLIQGNATSKRFGILSYTLDNSESRHGGVLRSNMKYVGPTLPDGSTNSAREYGTDGLLISNPDGAAGGLNSGVINYINKFSDAGYKSRDPISELFYEGIRYFKNLGRTPEFADGLAADLSQHGGFQVLTTWNDPIQHRCQKNFTVAINDANPWLDKRLPGTHFTTATIAQADASTLTLAGTDYGEPSNPDTDINVTALTNRVGELEGLNGATWSNSGTWQVTDGNGNVTASGTNDSVGGGPGTFDNSCSAKSVGNLGEVMGTCPSPNKQNSYYIAGLAYYANTNDLRDDMANDRGIQNVQSFVIDTQEFNNNPLDGNKNMLWLAGKYGGFVDANGDGIPQAAEWDANNDGMPDNYVLATNPASLVTGLNSAFEFIDSRTASASSASVNSGSISSDTRVYQARFDSGDWTGELLSFPVNTNGTLAAVEWNAADELPAANDREIITRDSTGTAIPFRWASLDSVRKLQIDPTYVSNDTLGTALVNYLRGDDSNEAPSGYDFRARPSKLGDIVASSPIFVGAPRFSYRDTLEDEPYSEFRLDNDDRMQVVYVGANDGMLHGFNAEDGEEVLAYIPTPVFGNLKNLSDVNYSHKFFVDAPPNSGDVFINDEWQTVLVGGLNKGGQGIYALNITDPSAFDEDNADDIVMWEFTDSDPDGATGGITGDADLGYTYSQPAIVRMRDGNWAAVFGNGYNNTAAVGAQSTSGHAVLYIVNIANGQLIKKIDTGAGSSSTPNGLATPAAVDINADAIVDYIYAGDLLGNMWKFDVRDASPTNWGVAYGTVAAPEPLFTAVDPDDGTIAQPITSRPEIIRGPRGVGMMVLFGTGKYLETIDKSVDVDSPTIQAYYGLWDQNTGTDTDQIDDLDDLVEQSILVEQSVTFSGQSFDIRVTSQHQLGGNKGWYLDLVSPDGYEGERQVSNSVVRAGRVIFTTLIPDADPCNFGGGSWLMELDALSGGRLNSTPFDLNNDGVFDQGDYVTVTIDGAEVQVPISGLQPDVGITPEPGVLLGEGGTKEFKYNPGTSGTISVTVENPGEGTSGRQSWRQIR